MKEIIEKMNSKKEYATPQMEVMDCKVEGFLCDSGDVTLCTAGDPDCAD